MLVIAIRLSTIDDGPSGVYLNVDGSIP